jgi:hypothetical protein
LRPAGSAVLRGSVAARGSRSELSAGPGWTLRSVRWADGSASLTATAISAALAEDVLARATDGAKAPEKEQDESVPVGFWHSANGSGRRFQRQITAAPWADLRANYAADAVTPLDRLMTIGPDDIRGRLLLLYGPPGTGKTTLLRSLAKAWRDWCQLDCVLDPERLFANAGYLMEVALGVDQNGDKRRWRLLLLEDCDELIVGEAKHASGQALSRLLNLTDGLLGQGRDVLIAITTNEDLSRLHPAVTRPGRCLAKIQLGPLPFGQAAQWLGRRDGIGPDGATLAQLYALRDGGEPLAVAAPEPATGLYL